MGWTMLTHLRSHRIRLLVAGLALSISTALGAAGFAAAANPNSTFDVTACATPSGDSLILTATWSAMRVTHWSNFIESSEGSGGTFQPVPQPGRFGSVSNTFPVPVDTIDSVSATVFRTANPNSDLASVTLTRPATGWPTC